MGAQLTQEFGRFCQRLVGLERVEQQPFGRRRGNELRDALSPLASPRRRSQRIRPQPAFLPNQASEKFNRQTVVDRRGLDQWTKRLWCVNGTSWDALLRMPGCEDIDGTVIKNAVWLGCSAWDPESCALAVTADADQNAITKAKVVDLIPSS